MDSANPTELEYPSKSCAKAEKAILDTFNKTRELTASQPKDWLPHVYACMLFPLPPDTRVPPSAFAFYEAVSSEYLRALSEDKSDVALNLKMTFHAKAGHVLALHTPLTMKEFLDGSFGDAFFSQHYISSEVDAKKTRAEVQAVGCNAYSSFDCKFNQSIGLLRPLQVTIREAVLPKAADSKVFSADYPLHHEDMEFKMCIYDASPPDSSSGLWFPITASNICKNEIPGFAILEFSVEDLELTVEGNDSACTHMHLHGTVKKPAKGPSFTWSMPLPNASISHVVLEGYVQGSLQSGKSSRTLRCAVSVQNTILTVAHPSSLKSDVIKTFGANICSYYLQFISMLMCYSGKLPSSNRAVSDQGAVTRHTSSSSSASVVSVKNATIHSGFASHAGTFIAQQLRTRFCLPVKVSAALELAARVSNFSANRDTVADLLVAAASLRAQNEVDAGLSGSKIIDNFRKNACIVARELCLDTISNTATELVIQAAVTCHLLDTVVISTAVLLSLATSDIGAAVNDAVAHGIERTCDLVSKRTKSEAHQLVLSDASESVQDDFGDTGHQVIDLLTKQAQIDLRSCISVCEIITGLLRKRHTFDSTLERFTEDIFDEPWYSSVALDQRAKDHIVHAQRIIKQACIPAKLIEKLAKILSQRIRKIASISFDDCTSQLWPFITMFMTLCDALKEEFAWSPAVFEGTSAVLKEISCGTSPASWLSRYAIVKEQKLQEAIVADELHSLVEVSYFGSRVYLWLRDSIATLEALPKPEAVVSPDFQALLVFSHQRFWEVLMVFVGKALMEILKMCSKELQDTTSDGSESYHGLRNLVQGIGSGFNAALNMLDPTAKAGETPKGVFATIKQAAFDTARAVRQGKGVISATAEATKGTVKTAFSVVGSTAQLAVQAGAAVASGVDAVASGVASGVTAVTGAALRVVGLGSEAKLAKETTFAASGGSVFFTISLIRAIEDAIRDGLHLSELQLSTICNSISADDRDIESAIQINFQKQYIEPLCISVCSQSSEFFELTFSPIVEGVLSGKQDGTTSWESAVLKGVNAIIVHVPDVNPDPILQLAAQDLYKSFVQVVFDQYCLVVARCGGRSNDQVALESLKEISEKLAQTLGDFSQNDFAGCASKHVSAFRDRITDVLKMQFSTSKDDLLKLLQESQVNQGAFADANRSADLQAVLKNRFKADANIQSLLASFKDRKWRSAFDIDESDILLLDTAASIQDVKDRNKCINGMLYVTHQHICFLENIDSAQNRGSSHKPSAIDLGVILVPASVARFRIQWARGDDINITPKDRTKIRIKGSRLDAALYQNSCVLSNFRITNPEARSNTYLKCVFADQESKSDTLKASKSLQSDAATGSFSYKDISGKEFSFEADLTGGGEKSLLMVSLRNVAGITQQTKGKNRVVCSHMLNPNSLELDEPRDLVLDLRTEKQDVAAGSTRRSSAASVCIVSFCATKRVRREALALPSNTKAADIIIRIDPPKARVVRLILAARIGDGRNAEHQGADVQMFVSESSPVDDPEPEVVEEGRFICRYWNSNQSVREAKTGSMVVTSDHISFVDSFSRNVMSCFVYEIKRLERNGSQDLVVHSELAQHHFDDFARFAIRGAHKGNQRDCVVGVLKKCYKRRFADKELQVA